MSLLGLHQRHTLCKICNAFEDARLNDITLDSFHFLSGIEISMIDLEEFQEKYK